MLIPSFITNEIPKDPKQNPYLEHADLAWKRLTAIKNKKTEYVPDDFSILINTLERFYKGFLHSMAENTEYKLPIVKGHEQNPTYYLEKDHYLKGLVREIESHFLNISPTYTKNERIQHDAFLVNLQ